jgi:hypothetical protein
MIAGLSRFVCGIFNSSVADYLIRSYALATGISTHVLDRLPIPRFSKTNKKHLEIVEAARLCYRLVECGENVSTAEKKLNKSVANLLGIETQAMEAISLALFDIS